MIIFEDMVAKLKKDGYDIMKQLSIAKADLLHMALGITTEAGELGDAIKKHAIYSKPIDIENIVEELGDLEFFLEGLRQRLGITREETIAQNIKKLGVRYKDFEYSDEQAHLRRDKANG